MLPINQVLLGDCLDVMRSLPDKSIDLILCDLPYGTTACKWDSVIPFEPLWEQYKRLIKPGRAIVLTASQPFTTALIGSNLPWFKYSCVWDKVRGVGFQIAKHRPMMRHEDVCIFGKGKVLYNPQLTVRNKIKRSKCYSASNSSPLKYNDSQIREYTHKQPTSIIEVSNASQKGKSHPTQKPVTLFSYLIKTYSNPSDIILDNCIGSGTTALAAIETGRNYIGIERDTKYHAIANQRIQSAQVTA